MGVGVSAGVKQTMRNPATHAELQLQRSVQGFVHMPRTRQSPVDRGLPCRKMYYYYYYYYSLTHSLLYIAPWICHERVHTELGYTRCIIAQGTP
jgi:hypothetical protein